MSRELLLPTHPYFVESWSDQHLQGDLFARVPFAMPAPPDAIFMEGGDKHFVSGVLEIGVGLLLTPSFVTAGGVGGATDMRTLAPVQTVAQLQARGAFDEDGLALLRADRLRGYVHIPRQNGFVEAESAAVLSSPVSMHRDVIERFRLAQMSAEAHRHLRLKLMAYAAGYLADADDLGPPGDDHARVE